jgi:leucyl-tRNA synthetase
MGGYQPHSLERKWQARWEQSGAHRARLRDEGGGRCYCLVMFSYPSGDKLHLGHWFNYAPTDTWARYRRMRGDHVFQPMGFDSFGLPAENYAIKMKVHPRVHTEKNIEYMRKQLQTLGGMYDWSHELQTHKPDYYRWTQWLFLVLYEAGYAYRKQAPVNWCDSCQTVLANEQVHDGLCERCSTPVRRRELVQWFFRITAFADDLLEGLSRIDWPQKTVTMQRNWIGRSEGALVNFSVTEDSLASDADVDRTLPIFTTRPDTIFGVTYMVLAPEHPLVPQLGAASQRVQVQGYVEQASRLSEIDRTSTTREKSGVFTGAYALNPVNGERIPIWIADYVLSTYGTGAVMAVPGHDQRDFEFATRFGLPIRRVILGPGDDPTEPLPVAWTQDGPTCNSGEFDGLDGPVARERVVEYLRQWGHGGATVNYRLRDWLVSRQRYWGAPIPIVHCARCGEVAVPMEQLPVLLPDDAEFMPTGESPLRRHPNWSKVDCPRCGGPAQRETDTMDTFVDSSWYYLRYLSPHRPDVPWDRALADAWLPVTQYVGGADHAVMHLLYARFVAKVLHRLGHVSFDEPFACLRHQGVITHQGARMSKSRGNVVSPEAYLDTYGSDALRMYLMFGFAFIDGGDWDDSGIHGIARYLARVHRFVEEHQERLRGARTRRDAAADATFAQLRFVRHRSVKGGTLDLDRFQFNTAIARHMELTNQLHACAAERSPQQWGPAALEIVQDWVRVLAPFAPHLGEELWEMLGHAGSVFDEAWPAWDEAVLQRDEVTVVVQVNGKVREQMHVARGTDREQLAALARAYGKVPTWIAGKAVVKVVVVPDKLVNIVVA